MKRIALSVLLSFLVITVAWIINAQTEQFESYDRVQEAVNKLEEDNKYEEAIEFMKSVEGKFPGFEYEIIREFAYLYLKTEQLEECLDTWEEGHKRGFFFLLHPNIPRYKPFKEMERFNELVAEDSRLRGEALEHSKTFYELELPEGFDENKKYPLLMVLHGGGSTITRARKHWLSSVLKRDYIVVFVQSYLHYGSKEFGWRKKDPRAREDIKNIYQELVEKYPIDISRVIIGGISAGGSAAMDISLSQIIATRGVIGVCPAVSNDEFTAEEITKARETGTQAYVITGENDYGLEKQQKIIELFESEKLPHKFIVIPGMGHEYPDDFSALLDAALTFFNDIG